MRVLVCGGRGYNDELRVYKELDTIYTRHLVTCLIHGAARGADSLGALWASNTGIPQEAYPAQWDMYGNRAGPIRNQKMLDEGKPDLVVAFPGGSGTADMVRRAKRAGVEVLVVE